MIFIDTTIWVSGIDASDRLHKDGKAVLEALVEGRIPPALTTDSVLDESLTLLKRRGANVEAIAEAMETIISSPLVRVDYVEEPTFRQTLSNFKKYEKLSFTDAVTLTIMNRYKIKEIYSHDGDFDLRGIIRKERP